MTLIPPSETRAVMGIPEGEITRIADFLQGATYCWCKNRPGDWFSLSELMGGENFFWQGTPLIILFIKHEQGDSENPVNMAGKDAGWLLKSVLNNDERRFEHRIGGSHGKDSREYRWLKEDA